MALSEKGQTMNYQLFAILLLAFPFAFPIAPAGGQAYSRTELPPLLEFLDFLQELRAQCGRRRPLIVVLWGGPSGVSETDRQSWALTLRQLRDPDLHLETIGTAP